MSSTMRAMVLERPGLPLQERELPLPVPAAGQVLIEVEACGVCRTDLHLVDGELPEPVLPMIPGHEIVGRVRGLGTGVAGLHPGQRIGVPWLGWTCGACACCRSGQENLCDRARFTGYQIQGGYAEYTVADARYCFPLAGDVDPVQLAPLLCAGLIGYRALGMAGAAGCIGLYGFGAAAHIAAQVIRHQQRRFLDFTRPGDDASQQFARSLGAEWAGGTDTMPPVPLDAALIFAPVGTLVPLALGHVRKGGSVVCAGIHMSDIPSFPYARLWGERQLRSVANLTRSDGEAFLALAPRIPIRTETRCYPLAEAGAALAALRTGLLQGAAVLVP